MVLSSCKDWEFSMEKREREKEREREDWEYDILVYESVYNLLW